MAKCLAGVLALALGAVSLASSPAGAALAADGKDGQDTATIPLSAQGRALLGFLGPLPVGLAADDLAKAMLAAGSSTERNPFGLLVRFTEEAAAVEVADVLGSIGGSLTGPSLDDAGLYLVETLRDLDGLRPESGVRHRRFGRGTITDLTRDTVTVLFDRVGYRTLATELVRERQLLKPA